MGLGRPEPCHNGLAEIVKEIVKNDLLATRSNGPYSIRDTHFKCIDDKRNTGSSCVSLTTSDTDSLLPPWNASCGTTETPHCACLLGVSACDARTLVLLNRTEENNLASIYVAASGFGRLSRVGAATFPRLDVAQSSLFAKS
jgi:hypothetical protein